MKRFRLPSVIDILGLSLLFGLLQPAGFAGDPGVGWHIRSGEWILTTLRVPQTDLFLHELAGNAPWVHTQWLADALFALLFSVGGFPLLHAASLLLLFTVWGPLLHRRLDRSCNSRLAIFLTLALCALMGATQWILRPVIFSFLFFSLTLQLLERDQAITRRHLLLIGAMFLLWAELHPAFVLGLALIFLAAVAALLSGNFSQARSEGLRLGAALFGTLLNPYGWKLHQGIWALGQSEFFMNLNLEWRSPDFHNALFLPFFVGLLLLLALALKSERRRLTNFELLSVLVFAAASLVYRRYIPFFSLVAAVPLARLIAGEFQQRRLLARLERIMPEGGMPISTAAALLILPLTLALGRLPLGPLERSFPNAHFPQAAVDALADEIAGQEAGGAIFHTPNWGGFITLQLWPNAQAFIDDRNEVVGEERYRDFFTIYRAEQGWKQLVDEYNFRWLLLEPESALLQVLPHFPDWKRIYQDPQAVIYERVAPVSRANPDRNFRAATAPTVNR